MKVDSSVVAVELARFAMFSSLTPGEVQRAAAAVSEELNFSPGAVICDQGSAALGCYLILEGGAEVLKSNTPIGTVSAGEPVGEMGAVENSFRNASVVAESAVRAYFIPGRELNQLLEEVPAIAAAFTATIAARSAPRQE
jgi:CRP-like cAMP-binding protein